MKTDGNRNRLSARGKRLFFFAAFFAVVAISGKLHGQSLIAQPTLETNLRVLKGNIHPPARVGFDRGLASADAPSHSRAEVNRAIQMAMTYLERACDSNGRFVYKVDIGTGRESGSYNIIRHEGAMYALALANRAHPDLKAVETLVHAAGFLRKNYLGPGMRPGQLVVWSKPITSSSPPENAELGGASLGLVALSSLRSIDPELVSLGDLQGLGRFVLFLQRDDGSFISKYNEQTGAVPHWDSLYYPGEAALGLVALYEADHSNDWLIASARAISFLAKSRTGLSVVPADHWALIATARLLPYSERFKSVVSREVLTQHAEQICASILKEQFHSGSSVGLDGAFDPEGRTAPTATRLEGLLATLEYLPKSELRRKIEESVERGIAFLMRAQVSEGPQAGGMPGAIFNSARDSATVRIDFVQHALCALIGYEKWLDTDVASRSHVTQAPGHIRVLFGGDTNFGENYQEEYAKKTGHNILAERGYDYSLANLARLLQNVDYRVLNLETPLTPNRGNSMPGKSYVHYSDPVKSPTTLGRFGPIIYSLANNHTLDQGETGLGDTFAALKAAGAGYFGAGRNLAEAAQPYVQEWKADGMPLTVAILGGLEYNRKYADQFQFYATTDHAGVAPVNSLTVKESIYELRRRTPDVYVIYFMHTLNNYQWASDEQEDTVHALRDAGVNLVVGAGAHMLQQIEYDGHGWAFLGLGNFLFNASGRYAEKQAPPYSLVLVVDFLKENGRLRTKFRAYPILSDNKLTNYQPRFLTKQEIAKVETLLFQQSHWNSVERAAIKEGKDEIGSYLEFANP